MIRRSPGRLQASSRGRRQGGFLTANLRQWARLARLVDRHLDDRDPAINPRVVECSHAEFESAGIDWALKYRFRPATAVAYRQNFDRVARDSPDNPSALRLIKVLNSGKDTILTDVSRLDEVPKPLYRAAVALAGDQAKKILPASAVVEFILDREGHVQLPKVTQASNEEFGWAAPTAVQRWKFSVPTQKGVPVDVVMSVPIEMTASL